eukprot:1769848-Prymnesium_polylepis.1
MQHTAPQRGIQTPKVARRLEQHCQHLVAVRQRRAVLEQQLCDELRARRSCFDHVPVARQREQDGRRRRTKRRGSKAARGIDRCSGSEQRFGGAQLRIACRHVKRRVAFLAERIRVGAARTQKLRDRHVPLACSKVQRHEATVLPAHGRVRAGIEQHARNHHLAVERRHVQSRVARVLDRVALGAVSQQEPHDSGVPGVRGVDERRKALRTHRCLHRCTTRTQEADDVCMALPCGRVQRRERILAASVDGCAVRAESSDGIEAPAVCGDDQRGVSIPSSEVGLRAASQQAAQLVRVVVEGGALQEQRQVVGARRRRT